MLCRDDVRIGDDVVVIRATHRTRISKPIDVDGSGTQSEHLGPRILGVAVEIDEDVDLVVGDPAGSLLVAETVDIEPVVDAALDAGLGQIGAADTAVVGVDFKMRPVVRLDQIRHGKAHGMLAEVGGDVADAQLAQIPPCRCGVVEVGL